MKITLFGTGYVGLVTGACLAEAGHQVLCVDTDAAKIAALRQGVIPIYEPGLEALVRDNHASGHLQFTTSAQEGVDFGECLFIAVGTPPDEDGSADLTHVLAVADSIGAYITGPRIVVDKSTVPVGTADKVKMAIAAAQQRRDTNHPVDIVSNPEFLKEGSAIRDFMKPDRIVIGTDNPEIIGVMQEIYAPFNRNHDRMITMDVRSAELTKYAANAMLATKISFMNELANIADRIGADIEQVRIGIGSDPRIGYQFIYAGCGYGGSCFPKDVRALSHTAQDMGYDATLLQAIERVNTRQKQRLFELIARHFGGAANLQGRTFALWGLAFKPNTDDMREAPSRVVMEALWNAGATVRAFDPEAAEETRRIYGERADLVLTNTKEEAARGSDALIICTEWKGFMAPDFNFLAEALGEKVIFDGRNLYDPGRLASRGWVYYGIGRSTESWQSSNARGATAFQS
ncbi:UDP-glucose 6-dehydrogenase YwqF [Pigmentiphaga humi]|uniref:UDP-glucose 6-dehydrogenase n=1 Tax=Pigmentiphaga humi TaxID=2478468 RepID=A0A3P4B5T4_9BURK|nr:UDP-glucose/GDP-mannose dehydrogenase family protein [Pigmentiphaga humi]VCU71422.1 UDP-glucose 6-dehydrogenase YwqF [Pigmentiphaga humi]